MFNALITLLIAAVALPFVVAQEQGPIYVPFEWNRIPATATVIGVSGQTTSYALIDGPGTGRVAPGPATLVQGPSGASMFYVNSAAATPTLSGICNLVSPVAVCTLNVYEAGQVLPGSGSSSTASRRPTSTGNSGGNTGGSGAAGSSAGTILMMTTVALGFCISLAFVR